MASKHGFLQVSLQRASVLRCNEWAHLLGPFMVEKCLRLQQNLKLSPDNKLMTFEKQLCQYNNPYFIGGTVTHFLSLSTVRLRIHVTYCGSTIIYGRISACNSVVPVCPCVQYINTSVQCIILGQYSNSSSLTNIARCYCRCSRWTRIRGFLVLQVVCCVHSMAKTLYSLRALLKTDCNVPY